MPPAAIATRNRRLGPSAGPGELQPSSGSGRRRGRTIKVRAGTGGGRPAVRHRARLRRCGKIDGRSSRSYRSMRRSPGCSARAASLTHARGILSRSVKRWRVCTAVRLRSTGHTIGVMAHAGSGDGEPTEAAAEYLMTIRYMHGEGQPVIAARLAERHGRERRDGLRDGHAARSRGAAERRCRDAPAQPDRRRAHGRRAHLPAPRPVRVAADRGHRARLGRCRRGGASPPERAERSGHRPDRRPARPPTDLPARQPDPARRPHARAAGRAARSRRPRPARP